MVSLGVESTIKLLSSYEMFSLHMTLVQLFSTLEVVQYIGGITSVLWGITSVLWGITSVHMRDNISTVGITSVLWRVFSTVGITSVQWGYLQYSGDTFSTSGG